jgi:uncharacterized membrane protein YeiB
MENSAVVPAELAPVSGAERIEALDVVRGFALIGILTMNVEFFNRALNDLGHGIQPGLSGANYWVGFFVQYFVIGKFWTIFSLLFGMGFAVMLTRGTGGPQLPAAIYPADPRPRPVRHAAPHFPVGR